MFSKKKTEKKEDGTGRTGRVFTTKSCNFPSETH